jgi:hypothetical protein
MSLLLVVMAGRQILSIGPIVVSRFKGMKATASSWSVASVPFEISNNQVRPHYITIYSGVKRFFHVRLERVRAVARPMARRCSSPSPYRTAPSFLSGPYA